MPDIVCDDPELRRHLDRPWLRAFLARRLGLPLTRGRTSAGGRAETPAWAWARHALIVGSTGSGKSRLTEHVLAQQLAAGQSLVAVDPKLETLVRLALRARDAGLPASRVVLLSPRAQGGTPGWNPLSMAPLPEAVGDVVAALQGSTLHWGHRLQDVLTNGCLLVGAHGLSVFELVECLRREEYLEGLLRLPLPEGAPAACREAARFFRYEFLAWSPSARREAAGPVLNKLRELLRSDFLSALLCARRTNVDLAGLWRRPGVVLIHLDRAALGEEGTRLLGGLAVGALFRAALRTSGPVPVTLSLDELSTAEHFAGSTLLDILAIARSRNLRLLAACQHLAQLSDGLRAALLANAAVQAFFRLGPADARLTAGALSVGTPVRLGRMLLEAEAVDRKTGAAPSAQWRHAVRDARGRPLRLERIHWEALRRDGSEDGATALEKLSRLLRRGPASGSKCGRLYVRAADTGEPVEVRTYVRGLRPGEWWLEGPAPLELVISFPRPKASGVERTGEGDAAQTWTRTLLDLPVRHAVLRVAGEAPALLKVASVGEPNRGEGARRFLAAALRAGGQTAGDVQDTRQWREARVEALSRGEVWRESDASYDGIDRGDADGQSDKEGQGDGRKHNKRTGADGIGGDGGDAAGDGSLA